MTGVLWPFALYCGLVVGVVAIMILSCVLGERHDERATGEPYESGMPLTGSSKVRFDPHFYLIAAFFVIFDLEALFVFAWAVGLKEAGWTGYIEMSVFIGLLLIALIYLWKAGGLEFQIPLRGRSRRPNRSASSTPGHGA